MKNSLATPMTDSSNEDMSVATTVDYEDFVKMAIICHQVNKTFCEYNGDTSHKDWDECEDWQKESVIAGVKFRVENPETTSEDMHQAWMQHKLDEGWVYGDHKDAENKVHPCLVPYDQLPENDKVKDSLFKTIVDAYLKGVYDN